MKLIFSKAILIFIFVLGFIIPNSDVYAVNQQRIFPASSKIARAIWGLSIAQGSFAPSSSGPWSEAELRLCMEGIERSKLSGNWQKLFDSTKEKLAGNSRKPAEAPGFSGSASLSVAFEGYAHSNINDFTEEKDWQWKHENRSPLALAEGEVWIGDLFYLYSNLGLKANRFAESPPYGTAAPSESLVFSPGLSFNLPGRGKLDFDTPARAFIAVGENHSSLQFGRDLVKWGPGLTGDLIIGDDAKYHEFIRLSLFTRRFKFTSLAMFTEPPGYTTNEWSPYIPSAPGDPTVKIFLAHRLEFALSNRLRLELSENVMYQDTDLNLKFFNPLFIFHNLSNRSQFNAIADIYISATIVPGLAAYAVVAVDQMQAPSEGSDQPNAMGYQAGIKAFLPWGRGILSLNAEAVLTDPYLYLRDIVDLTIMARERSQYWGYVPHRKFLGYRYGGDALVLMASAQWEDLEGFSCGGELFWMAHGPTSIDTEYSFGAMPIKQAPSSPVVHQIRASLWGELEKPAFGGLCRLWSRIDVISRMGETIHPAETDVQIIMGVSQRW